MRLHVGAATHRGNRARNEDRYGVVLIGEEGRPLGVFLVADGVGGAQAGERASTVTVQIVMERAMSELNVAEADPESVLVCAVEEANARLYREAEKDVKVTGMGCTCTAVMVVNETVYVAHVGDSRAYLIREGNIRLLTEDHVDTDTETRDLVRALGWEQTVEVDREQIQLEPRDRILLCTDGMYHAVGEARMAALASGERTAQEACDHLIARATQYGVEDNVTVVLIEAVDDDIVDRPVRWNWLFRRGR